MLRGAKIFPLVRTVSTRKIICRSSVLGVDNISVNDDITIGDQDDGQKGNVIM